MKTPPGWDEVRVYGSLYAVPPVSDAPFESWPVSACCDCPPIDDTFLCSRCRCATSLVEEAEDDDQRVLRLIRKGVAVNLGDEAPETFYRYE